MKKIFDLFIFSSLYISLCAVLMVCQTYRLLLHSSPPGNLLLFISFSTICSYNFHWYLTAHSVTDSPRLRWTIQNKSLHLVLYFIGLIGSSIYFFKLREHWFWIGVGIFVTFLYSAPKIPQKIFSGLKKVAIGKTIFLAFVWMYVTTALPIFVADTPWQTDYILFAVSRFFLIYAICILFDYRDREDDKNDNILSMITYFNEKGINSLFVISLIVFATATIGLYWYHYSIFIIIILLIPGIIVAVLYNYAKRNFSDYLYYFVLDGLMMFSGLLMLIFKI